VIVGHLSEVKDHRGLTIARRRSSIAILEAIACGNRLWPLRSMGRRRRLSMEGRASSFRNLPGRWEVKEGGALRHTFQWVLVKKIEALCDDIPTTRQLSKERVERKMCLP
jgi:hypothetical protein